jgi:hypothetical protein
MTPEELEIVNDSIKQSHAAGLTYAFAYGVPPIALIGFGMSSFIYIWACTVDISPHIIVVRQSGLVFVASSHPDLAQIVPNMWVSLG